MAALNPVRIQPIEEMRLEMNKVVPALTVTVLVLLAAVGVALFGSGSAQAAVQLSDVHMTVTKSPTCGCCGDYIDILRRRGVNVTVIDVDDISVPKLALGIPTSTWSCHTTEAAGYVIEGHVPLEAIEQLLAERPDIVGIGLPGMPLGSPGMNGPKSGPFQVLAFNGEQLELFGSY